MGKVMRLLSTTFFALFVIAFAGTSTAQGAEAKNPQAVDVFRESRALTKRVSAI